MLSSVLTAALLLIARPAPWQVLPNVSCTRQKAGTGGAEKAVAHSRGSACLFGAGSCSHCDLQTQLQCTLSASTAQHRRLRTDLHGCLCADQDVGGSAHAAANQHWLPNLLRGARQQCTCMRTGKLSAGPD